MGKPFWRSVEYFFTGNYSADDGNNTITAIGAGGVIHAYGGDDHIKLGSLGATVYTGEGNDTVDGGALYLRIDDTGGNLKVHGAAGYADINKSGDGNVTFEGAAGGVDIEHTGRHGRVDYAGAAAYNRLVRKGDSGGMSFSGAGGYNSLWHETNDGDLSFSGAGAGNKIDRTWFDKYKGSHGNVSFYGAGAANSISSRVETGNIFFAGVGADNHLVRRGKAGDITMKGAGASNRIERTRNADDVYTETRGDIVFEGAGGYNSLYSDVAHGNIHFSGAGAYNEITRKGTGNHFKAQGIEYAKAGEVILTKATMHGISIGHDKEFHPVQAVKSQLEPNTYLFAIADSTYTKINKIHLYNDSETGKLKYYSEAWFKRGNHLENLTDLDVSYAGGFESNPVNGGYTLSDLKVEHQKPVTIHAVEENLTENQWVTYGGGTLVDAADVTLADAKMSGYAVYADGTAVDVSAVKSNRKPNTYIYAKKLGAHTKMVVVELANDKETGELKYLAKAWYKTGDHTADLANAEISIANGFHEMGTGGYSLSDLNYSVNAFRTVSENVADIDEYSDKELIPTATDVGDSSGDVRFEGAGGGNVINSNVTRGNVYFHGGGIANVIQHSSKFGDTEFIGGGAANVIVKSGEQGDLTFRGAGLANVLVHQGQQGKMDVNAGGAANVLVRVGDGEYLAHLLAIGNISVHKGNGDSQVTMLGGFNTHTQAGNGNASWMAAGGFNVMTQSGKGEVASVLAGGANVLSKIGDGNVIAGMLGGANVITHIHRDTEASDTTAVALGGANILTKKGKGDALAVMGGGANVLTHVGDGATTGVMVGGANVLTKVGNGDTTGVMLGIGNVLTHVGDGQTLGVMGAVGNIFTKVGDGTAIAAMAGAGNIFTHVGEGDAWALMGGMGNVFTKVGNGNALALMVAEANVFTHIGDGMSVALMLAKGNVATKVGNGTALAAMVGNANIFTHIGNGDTFAAMIGQANIMTKVGDDLTAALMVGKANIMTHVGDGTSLGMFAGEANIMTKVGDGTTLAAMFGKVNIMTHVGDGLTGVLALGEANIVTKVGDDFMGVVAAAKANVVTHVGDATTAAVLAGKGNILTKVGEGTTVGLLLSEVGNVMTHVGDGATVGFAKGKANIITKVGDGLGINAGWGNANVFTHVGDGDRYNFAKGEANVITKVGDGQEVSVVQGKANIVTHVGNGDDYTGAWGEANVITKVGEGRNVVLAKGEANIVTQVGSGDSFNALWSKGNIVTKVGDGMQVTAAKGQANITTTVGNGLSVTAAYGDANINTKVGDGLSVNVAWGKFNVNTKVGDGLNVAVMKGKANANIHVGDGLGINASYAQNNVAIKIGNGDFYSLAVAASNTSSNKLSALFDNIKQTVLGVGGSQAINYLVQGDDASASGSRKGKGAIDLAEVSSIDGFQMDEIDEVSTDLGDSLSSSVTAVETPDLDQMQSALSVKDAQGVTSGAGKDTTSAVESEALSDADSPNLITNGDFSLGGQGWQSTNGIEADFWASAYGIETNGQDSRVSELATAQNTTIYQDLQDLVEGSVISLNFDFAKRQGISADNGIEVIWNGDVVFSSSGDESVWQQKSLELTAQAGTNRIEFKGTGENDGLGYVLDNVVAKVEKLPQEFAVTDTDSDKPNLIINGDFEQGGQGWQSTNGIEADYKASVYGIDDDGHGSRVTELATATNTSIFQDLQDLADGEVISLSFDFAKREGISADKGIEVIWNGDVVFSTSGDESVWQQKTMQLAAKAGSNRIEFKGTGQNNGLGYILDNVVAKSEGVPQSNHISEYAKQDEAAKNAMADKARAEADRERLEQEKEKQLAALSGSQSQLESTDQQALENNGQVQRDEVKSEADEVTAELTAMAQGLDALEGHADYNGESGNSWREHFAGGILDGVQGELDSAKDVSDEYLSKVLTAIADNQKDVKEAVAKSEAGAAKGEQHRAGAEQDIADAKADAAARKAEALSQQEGAEQAERDAHSALQDAQSRGERDTMAAENKASQAQADAKGAKLDDDYRPDREGAAGSGLSGDGFDVQGASETAGHVDAEATAGAEALAEADGRYSEDLAEEGLTEEEQEALEAAKEAVNQLQINAGVRSRDSGATISSMFTQAHADSIVASVASGSDALGRKGPEISGVNLEGLGEATKTSDSSVIDRAYQVADIYRWLEFGDRRANTGSLNVPGVDPYQVDIYKSEFVSMANHVAGYIDANNSSIPRDNLVRLASLFVQSTIQYDWNGRLRFLQALEQLGYSFEPAHGKKTVAAFRSSGSRSEYRDVFSTEGNQVVFERDIPGIAFANELNKQLLDWGGTHLNMREQGDAQLMDSIFAATDSNAGFWKSVHAAGTQGDAYVVTDGGLRVDNAFWNTELPVLRELQREGLVGEIRLLDKPASEYQGVSPEKIGHRLTDADVTVTARFDSLSTEQQQRLMTDNPGGYQPDSVVELNVKANAIDDMLHQSIPFYGLRAERNLLLQEGESSFEVRDPSGNSDDVKHIIVNPEDLAQIKSMERFILANFDSYDQLPEELYLVDGKVLSQQDGRTRLLAQKLDGVWQYKPKTELMSEAELLEAAFVKGKLRGESYQKVIDALADYHAVLKEYADNELEAVEKLTNLHKQIEGYLLGHPDSQRAQGLKILLDQVNVRIEEVSVLAESEKVVSAQESFSRLYDQLDNANLKSGKHLYIDNEGNFVTKGKGNIAKFNKLSNGQDAVSSVKAAVAKEYGQEIADDVFTQLSAKELAKDGKGIDISGLKNIHRAIEQAVSPFSATLYVWKPSDHSYLGHTALQIGQGRVHVKAEDAPAFNQNNYVSWWPLDSKSLNPKRIQGVVASPHETLTSDMESEEGDGFGLESADIKLKRFIEKMNAAKGDYTKFKDVTEAYTMTALMNPEMLESAGIDPSVYQPFVDQWNDTGNDMTEVAKRFAEALRNKAQQSGNSEAIQRRINNVVRQFAERELEKIEKFRAEEADKGRVFRINLEGLDVASMQAEWQRIRNQPDARYQLLTKNCSSTVAKVLKAGGADKLIGHNWRPKFGVWTPTELYNFGQALQEAQLEIVAKKQKRQSAAELATKHQIDNAELLKSMDSDLKRYGEALKPDTSRPGKAKDIRATDEFLGGYKQGYAAQIVDGFSSDMNIKQLVDLLVKGQWTAEQKGALAWEIESRALKVTFQPKAEKYNRLFRDVVSDGGVDSKAREQQAPQLLLLNLSNDGFGGRCDPLSKLVLVAKQLENDGQDGVARQLLEKMYSAAAVLSNPEHYSDTERANADKLLGSLAALHAKNPMHDTFSKVWKEKLEDNNALTVNAMVEKVTESLADGKPVLLELDGPGHAMAAWAKGAGENRVYGFYDPNAGIVEFSSAEKFSNYVNRFFGKSDLNMAQRYKLPKNQLGEVVFSRVVVMDGNVLSKYKPTPGNKITMQGILDLPVFQHDYKSRDLVIKPLKHQESIELGMPEVDQKALSDIAERENVIIGVRPVDEKSKSLIASKMYSSKGLFVKAKSSDWGPMSGFIPVDQSFAKASARRDLAKFNGYAEQSIQSGNAVGADLYLNQIRVDELVSKYHSLTPLELDAESGMYKTTATNGVQTVPFFLNKVIVDGKELWQVHYMKDGELAPFKVIGDPVSKQPMTADYDLLTVMHPYGDLGPQDKVKQPLTWEQWKESVTYEDLTPKYKELYDNEALYNKKDGASLGIVSDRLKELKDVINTGLGRTNGLEMVHHGADDANPYAVMADNFPATFFVPKSFFAEDGLGEGKGSIQTYFNVNEQGAVVIRNPQEFSNFQQVAINASYRASLNDKWNAGLDKPLFTKEEKLSHAFLDARDELAKKLNGEVLVSEKDAKLTGLGERQFVGPVQNRNVENWESVAVTPQVDGGETRFDGQIIIQAENDPVAAKAAARLAGKHPDSSVVVQLDADGKYYVVYGEPSQLSGKLRWQVVGHGRDESVSNNTSLSGHSADELAAKLAQFSQDFSQAENITAKPDHISIVGCSLVSDDKQKGFAQSFITAMAENGIQSDVSARNSDVAVDSTGRKHTRDANEQWAHKVAANKVVLSWNEQGEVVTHIEAIRNGIAEGDVDLARVGQNDSEAPARGAIGDNGDVFTAPEKRTNTAETSSGGSDSQLSYSGNIQVNVGDGEFTAVNWGTSNVGIKVGTGGFKSLAFGDNNVMVHVGNGDSKHSFDMAGYQALEGAQMFIGNRNVSFNMGRSNDLIVMADKSIPTPPLVNPFDGASRISGVLQGIARSGDGQDWLAAQEKQWTLSGAKKFVKDMSGLDQSSSVDYISLIDLDSQHERSSRGLKHDAEATLNKQYNQWLSGSDNSMDTSTMSRADKFRQANEKLAFNFAVGGQGADIQVTTGNWNFMFGDNIQSILDTNLGSLFGLMTQQFSATGQAKTTFTYNPQDLPRQLKNKLLGKLAGVGAETTLGDIFGVDYTAGGHIVSRNGESVDGVAILKEMLEVIGEFSGDQLQAFTDPTKLLDSLKSGIDMGADGIKSFAESHGLKEKAPEEEEDKSSVSVNGANTAAAEQTAGEQTVSADSTKQERAFGFNALNLPNLFATIFSQDKQTEMKSLVENLKDNLTADLLNMKEQTFDFLRNSGHLQGDGDINVSLGNYNFNWGGDGKDLGAYLGDNNNFWGGRGDDVYYATGTSNIFTGGEGNDMGVLMGRENMMFGGDGNDTAVVAGRINHVFMGAGDDQSFVFGEGGEINTGTGRDYVVTSGNFNRVDTGEDQDYSVTIGNNNQVELGGGNDFANVFGNYNRVSGSAGNDVIKLMGYHAVLNGGEGDDHLIAAAISKFSQFDGGQGRDLMVLGGYQNTFKGGEDVDSFIVSGNVIDNLVEDIRSEDNIVFNGVDWQNLWFERSGYDLKLSVLREPEAETDQAKFESVGSVTFADYFNGNRADLVIGMGEKDAAGEREYTALSDNAVDALVQAMSSFAPQAGDNGFIDNLDSKARVAVTTAWSDVTNGKGAIA